MAQIIGREARYQAYLAMLKEDFTPCCEIEVLNPDGTLNYVIGNEFIQAGSNVNVSFQNGTRRTASINLENTYAQRAISPDSIWFGQQYRIMAGLYLPDGTPYLLPQGVFYVNDPEHQLNPNNDILELPLTDKWAYLDGTLFGNLEGNYVANINENIYLHIKSILELDRGNGYAIDSTKPLLSSYFLTKTVQLPDGSIVPVTNVPYTMRMEADGRTYADVLLEFNDMLTGIIGYDNVGRLRVEPSNYDVDDWNKPRMWEFTPSEREFLGATYSVKMSQVYNVVQVVGATLNGMQASAEVVNDDITSSTSIYSSLGRRVKRLTDENYYSDDQCKALGLWHLKRLNTLQQSVSFNSSPIYHLQENTLVSVLNPQKNNTLMPHIVNSFSLPLGVGNMTLDVTSVTENNLLDIQQTTTRICNAYPTLSYSINSSISKGNAQTLPDANDNITIGHNVLLEQERCSLLSGTINTAVGTSADIEYRLSARMQLSASQTITNEGDLAALAVGHLIASEPINISHYSDIATGIPASLLTTIATQITPSIEIVSLPEVLCGINSGVQTSQSGILQPLLSVPMSASVGLVGMARGIATDLGVTPMSATMGGVFSSNSRINNSNPNDLDASLTMHSGIGNVTLGSSVAGAEFVAMLNSQGGSASNLGHTDFAYLNADSGMSSALVSSLASSTPNLAIASMSGTSSYSATLVIKDMPALGASSNGILEANASISLEDGLSLRVRSGGRHSSEATLSFINNAFSWNTYNDLGTISSVNGNITYPPTDVSGEIHLTFTTGNTVSSGFWNIDMPSGYVLLTSDYSDSIETNSVYESTIYNTGQTNDDGNVILGVTTIKWS